MHHPCTRPSPCGHPSGLARTALYHAIAFWLTFTAFVLSAVPAHASEDRRIRIALEIFPRIVALDQDLPKRLNRAGQVELWVCAQTQADADSLASDLRTLAPSNIRGYPIAITPHTDDAATHHTDPPTAIFIGDILSRPAFESLRDWASSRKTLLFSAFPDDVTHGAHASVFIGSRVLPYLNRKTILRDGIHLDPKIFALAKVEDQP